VGIGAFAGSLFIQHFSSSEIIDFKKASVTGLSFFAVMSIYTFLSTRKNSE
tara:strand:+ start:654 stop:806 length:153 start_codon:yes stop_codon:yes gene_type:complete